MIEKRLEKDNRSNKKALVWKDISIRVNEKAILENCWGYSEPGSLVAIMGQSGAGKTTLLSVICGQRLPNMKMTGSVSLNAYFRLKPTGNHTHFAISSNSARMLDRMMLPMKHSQLQVIHTIFVETLQFTARLKIKDEE